MSNESYKLAKLRRQMVKGFRSSFSTEPSKADLRAELAQAAANTARQQTENHQGEKR